MRIVACPSCGEERAVTQPTHSRITTGRATGMCRSCTTSSRPRAPLDERFWAKVDRASSDACWPWLATHGRFGYGEFKVGGRSGRSVKAHRVAWELTHGPISDGLFVLHRCDNPPCCNPGHLFLGTHADNMRDMAQKGRQRARWTRQRIVIGQAA